MSANKYDELLALAKMLRETDNCNVRLTLNYEIRELLKVIRLETKNANK